MIYYIWQNDYDYQGPIDVNIPEQWIDYPLYMSKEIDVVLEPINFIVTNLNELPDALSNKWNYLVFNEKLRQVISANTNDPVQYLNGIITDKKSDKQINQYKIANTLVEIAAIDKERSLLDYFEEGHLLGVDFLVIDEKKVGNHSLFRLAEFVSLLIVREDLVNAIIDNCCTGMEFVPANGFRI